MNFKFLNILYFLFSFISINGYIHQINLFDKLCCFGDIHLGSNAGFKHPNLTNKQIAKINQKQAKDIINIIKNDNNNPIVIVEDMFDYKHDHKINHFFSNTYNQNLKNDYTSCIAFLNRLCKKNNIPVKNIEFRQSFVLYFCESKILTSEFLKHFNELIKEISNYDDTDELNKFYQKSINKIIKNNAYFLKLLHQNKDHYLTAIINLEDFNNKEKKYVKEMHDFLNDYHKLFDVKLMHEIFKQGKNKNIFVCAGNKHILRVKKLLKKINYKHIYESLLCKNPERKPINIKIIMSQLFNKNENPHLEFVFNFILIFFLFALLRTICELIYLLTIAKQRIFLN